MSRTTLCFLIATLVAMASLACMALRWRCFSADGVTANPGAIPHFFEAISLQSLPAPDLQLVELLLLLPIAALMICIFRNVIGLNTFGTFTPALIGLAFRDLHRWSGILVFVGIILAGWLMRGLLHRLHLLQVPRTSLLLSFVVVSLIGFVLLANRLNFQTSRLISLFPLIILTGMIERLWTLGEEDNSRASFFTLMNTLAISACIALVIGRPFLIRNLLRHPEATGLIVAGQLLLGRYTGFRLTELYRFRELMNSPQRTQRSQRLVREQHKTKRTHSTVT